MNYHLLLLILHLISTALTSATPSPSSNTAYDYGRVIPNFPSAILEPETPQDISQLIASISSSPSHNNITIAPRGAAHSTYGQANAPGGVIIDMQSLQPSIQVVKAAPSGGISYVDAGGGALWVDVLKETLKHGLTPMSWTDYLYLTVGGTLSVGGISGQTFKYGPQIANVLELDVITGKGEELTCSSEENSDLFYGVIGGLGQFGIIIRARIILKPSLRMESKPFMFVVEIVSIDMIYQIMYAKRVSIPYNDFIQFTRDQELLISAGEVDYLEGFVKLEVENEKDGMSNGMPTRLSMNGHTVPKGSNIHYLIELAIYYDEEGTALKIFDQILLQLRVEKSTVNIVDMSYFDFLNRVRVEEESLRLKGLWDVAHPWMNLFVPRVQIGTFKDLLLRTISATDSSGPIIIYPTLMQKWDPKMSNVLPQDASGSGIMYVVSVLRAAPLSCTSGTPCLDNLLQPNQNIISTATAEPGVPRTSTGNTMVATSESGMGAKQYMPYWKNEKEWMSHFGEKWESFKELKSRFDPMHILTPGQRIFKRNPIVV